MHTRTVAATSGTLLGFCALVLPIATAEASAARQPTTVAHRGASAYTPENTLAAVDEAHKRGITWVENDVQRTKDGRLVVMHDTTLNRTTDAEQVYPGRSPWKISDFTLAQIQRLDAGSWFAPEYRGQRVPTLKQYLAAVDRNKQNLMLEIKAPELYPGIEKEILAELRKEGWLSAGHLARRLIVQSFSTSSVKAVHRQAPGLKTAFLGMPKTGDLPDYAKFTDQINPSHKSVTADYLAAVHRLKGAHDRKLELFTWTVNDGPTAVRLAKLGVDGIITNTPDVVRDAVAGKKTAAKRTEAKKAGAS
ncbi:glycerophosphodiester phosphodiesterase [Streptomyces meridianus]|uniref:Glycerophosphodiester phosphodiesterase n=1 Tax=Streptomyces meridianus TaxID=2938945 RepID=A0ABT0XA64_9ACTN|nr:glycerophosphodiester phosphodiesterase family protein [Streptomyces meridianus]MCM2578689.1 glycerophosphodiester phosphodiesterase [Streptomyces meridianus]